MTFNHPLGAGYKYSAKDLSLSQIVAIVNSDHDSRGKAGEMADGWRAAAVFAEKLRTELESSKETLAANFHTPNSDVFFGHLADFVASAESAVTPAEMNAESLESAVVEVERIKPVIDDLVAEDALYEDNRSDLTSRSADGSLTEYDMAKADVLAEAQDQFGTADQQYAGYRYTMDPPTVFEGPEWHGPDRISDMDGYRNAYYPDGQPATSPGYGPSSLPGQPGSITPTDPTPAGPTPSTDAPDLQSAAPVAAPAAPAAPAPTPAAPGVGGPALPPAGMPPVTGHPASRGGLPVRTAPPAPPPARPTPTPVPRTGQTPGLPPRSGTSPTQSPTPPRTTTNSNAQRPGGQSPVNRQTGQASQRSSGQPAGRQGGQPGQRPGGQPHGRPSGQTSRNTNSGGPRLTPTTRSNPPTAQGRNSTRTSPNGPTRGSLPGSNRTSNGRSGAPPRGMVKPNAGFEQSINRNLPRSVPSVVGARESNSVKPVTRPAPGRVIGARKNSAPQHKPGSLTRNGVVGNTRKPAESTWSRTQPVRKVDVPRNGVIGRREYFIADTTSRSQVREARNARRKARLAHLTGNTTPVQNDLMTGITDHTVPGVIGRRLG
ncbi:hypothetical protein FB566_1858 [Stackebrandtia endophytica]|uniref:PPE family protein n=1 Tax=Stackebrandtia endophytica TaxID=1496996 RepID=A0A543AUW4_9ACTN|nr:hypothetical protein [Stackebrandtia endophytica]TQL76331.1 hypothetical protein FB566_1858 [Stackebrandtia endophytica]